MSLQKYFNVLPYLIIISAFGVYIGYGFRIEHLIIYPSFILFLITIVLAQRKVLKSYLVILLNWFTVVSIALIVSLFNGGQLTSIVADAESFIQPMVLMVLMVLFMFLSINTNEMFIGNKLLKSCQVLIIMLSLNSIFTIISMFVDITQIGGLFWGSEGESSVAYKAMTNGRFSGVFNQPMEAGVMYSMGLFAWLYLSDKTNTLKLRYVIALFLMVIGGLVTVSKVFLFGGLLLFFVGVLFNKNIWKMIFQLIIWSVIIGGGAYYFLFKTWAGLNYLFRFFGSNESFLSLFTAGRFGENSVQGNYFSEVWNESPIFGKGFGVTETYDSGFFQFFGVSGMIGFIIYLIILLDFIYLSFKYLKQNGFKGESKLFTSLTILLIGSSFGAPTLTLNRVSTVLWIFVGMLFQYFYFESVNKKNKIDKDKQKLAIA